MAAYATRVDIELVFGKHNVAAWAAMDPEPAESDITARVNWALDAATARIDARLGGGLYTMPFDEAPTLIKECCARLAGVLLYDARGVVDVDADGRPENRLAQHRKEVERILDDIRSGAMRLPGVDAGARTPDYHTFGDE
jgi:phage gp36-like protein